MTSHTIRSAAAAAMLAVFGSTLCAQAAGFAIYEASTKGNAMGGAVVGRATDASTVYHNPANMTRLPGVNTLVGVTIIAPDGEVTYQDSGTSYSLHNGYFTPPHAYATYQVDERWWLGVGIYSPFGLGTDYKLRWRGEYDNAGTRITTVSLNPNVAFQVTDDLSLALGLQVMYLDLSMRKNLAALNAMPPQILSLGKMNLTGDSVGYGWDAALAYDITDTLSFGLVYRSRVKQEVRGDATLDGSGKLAPALGLPAKSDAAGDLTLPESVTAGLNYQATEQLNLGVAATFTGWSSYERLVMRFKDGLGPLGTATATTKDWENVWRYGVGADYALGGPWSVQAGYIYDQCPIKTSNADFLLPAGNRNLFSMGLCYDQNDWTLQAGYTYLLVKTTHYDAPTTGAPVKFENGDAHMVALSVGKKF
jgi:long-chain fatty acid transport protein